MLVACRLAGLPALETHSGDVAADAQSARAGTGNADRLSITPAGRWLSPAFPSCSRIALSILASDAMEIVYAVPFTGEALKALNPIGSSKQNFGRLDQVGEF